MRSQVISDFPRVAVAGFPGHPHHPGECAAPAFRLFNPLHDLPADVVDFKAGLADFPFPRLRLDEPEGQRHIGVAFNYVVDVVPNRADGIGYQRVRKFDGIDGRNAGKAEEVGTLLIVEQHTEDSAGR